MSRFDLYQSHGRIDYYLDVQSDFHADLGTRMVIPVIVAPKVNHMNRLMVALTIGGSLHYAITPMMAAVPTRQLGQPVGNAAEKSHEITAAIDFLLQGF